MPSKKRKILPKSRKLLRTTTANQERHRYYDKAIALALRRELSGSHNTNKILMRWTGAGGRTVCNWLAGVRGPTSIHLVSLMEQSNEVFRTVLVMAKRMPTQSEELGAARTHAVELLRFLDDGIPALEGRGPARVGNESESKSSGSRRFSRAL